MLNLKKSIGISAVLLITLLLSSSPVFAAGRVGKVNSDAVNLRTGNSIEYRILNQVFSGDRFKVMDESDGWYKVIYEDTTAWIKSDFLDVSNEVIDLGVINDDNVNFRNDSSTEASVIGTLNKGDRISVLDVYSNWYKIRSGESVGYVYADFVSIRNSEVSRGVSSNNDLRSNIAAYSKRFLGVDYVYGGNSPDPGFDCSGFAKYIMAQYGINLQRVAADQALQGRYVSMADLRPGDLVFFDTDGGSNYINHVGIYIGGGQFIHAAVTNVVITNLSDSFYQNSYMTARNILD